MKRSPLKIASKVPAVVLRLQYCHHKLLCDAVLSLIFYKHSATSVFFPNCYLVSCDVNSPNPPSTSGVTTEQHKLLADAVRGLQVASCVLQIQQLLPRARVVYCSATGVSEVGNMAYMTRLGLWGSGRACIIEMIAGHLSVVNNSRRLFN